MSRKSRSSPCLQLGNVSRCAKDRAVLSCCTATTVVAAAAAPAPPPPLTDVVVEKQHLTKLAMHSTSCAGCIASVKALLSRPLSELRMLKAIVDEHGPSALRLKDAYVNNPKRTKQLFDTFPMSSALKKVQPVGSAQRCQLHRRLYPSGGFSSSAANGGNGGCGAGGGGRGGVGGLTAESWDWEDAWERMPSNLRCEVATIKASALEAAMHHATESNRFCSDCKHNVVQAHDILMGKVELEGSENEEEYDEEMFLPFEDRVFDSETGNVEDKVLVCDVMDVEDLIYWHEDFSSQDFDSSCSGQQRHAATLEHGQREVRSILGALMLSQLRSVWHAQTAQVQGEQYLFCLVVDAVRTLLAAHGAAPHGDDLMAIDAEEKCAAEGRRQKRRQKRKDRKRAGKAQQQQHRQRLPSGRGSSASASALPGREGGNSVANPKLPSTPPSPPSPPSPASGSRGDRRGRRGGSSGGDGAATAGDRRRRSADSASSTTGSDGGREGRCEAACGGGEATAAGPKEGEKARVESSSAISSCLTPGFGSAISAKSMASHGGFGSGGLMFQLDCGHDEDTDDDYDVDPDLLTEMEELKTSGRSRSDIDFLRKTLRQNYDRFIAQGAGRVH